MREGKVAEGQTCIPFSASLHPFREVWMCVCVCVTGEEGWVICADVHQAKCSARTVWTECRAASSVLQTVPWPLTSRFSYCIWWCFGTMESPQTAAENLYTWRWVWNLKRVYWVVTEYKIIIWKNRNIPLKMFLKAPFQRPSSFISPVQRRRKF